MILENKYNLELFQGSTFYLNISVKNADGSLKDLAGASARMQIRTAYNSSNVVEQLSTSNGEISVNATSSTLNLTLPAIRTANISVNLNDTAMPPRSKYVYDLELEESNGYVSKLLFGEIVVFAEVTR